MAKQFTHFFALTLCVPGRFDVFIMRCGRQDCSFFSLIGLLVAVLQEIGKTFFPPGDSPFFPFHRLTHHLTQMTATTSVARQLLAVAGVLLVVAVVGSNALPFGPKSGVTELTPQTLPQFLNTHKPVFLLLYAPWCGHCKSIHPEWEKFAGSVKDIVRVGAIDADKYRDVASQFGVKGFPTIKFYKMGNKKGMKPSDYQGARTAGAIQSAALAEIHSKGVVAAADEAAIRTAMGKTSSGKAIVLFSNKNKAPPIFSVLSSSPHFAGKVAFVFASSSNSKALIESFQVAKFPSLFVTALSADGELEKVSYEGSVDYVSIAKHLQSVLGIASDSSAHGEDAGDSESNGKKETEKNSAPKSEKQASSSPKVALPVGPVPLSIALFPSHCGHGALKLRGQQPLCVLSFQQTVSLDALHGRFGNDGVLFFDATAAPASIRQQLTEQLGEAVGDGDVVVLRAFKQDSCKFYVVKDASDASVDAALQRVVGGELSMKKAPFVTLKDE